MKDSVYTTLEKKKSIYNQRNSYFFPSSVTSQEITKLPPPPLRLGITGLECIYLNQNRSVILLSVLRNYRKKKKKQSSLFQN